MCWIGSVRPNGDRRVPLLVPLTMSLPGGFSRFVLPEVVEESTRGQTLFSYACSLEDAG
jgi:hypothetical protein